MVGRVDSATVLLTGENVLVILEAFIKQYNVSVLWE